MLRRDRYMVDHASLLMKPSTVLPAVPGIPPGMPCARGWRLPIYGLKMEICANGYGLTLVFSGFRHGNGGRGLSSGLKPEKEDVYDLTVKKSSWRLRPARSDGGHQDTHRPRPAIRAAVCLRRICLPICIFGSCGWIGQYIGRIGTASCSRGHTAPGLYAALALRGFFPEEDLLTLRHIGSHLQGHPNMNLTPGVDMSTGSLGQGISAAAGMALAAKYQGRQCRVYALLGDGEIQEARSGRRDVCPSHKLDNLCVIVDNNGLQIGLAMWLTS